MVPEEAHDPEGGKCKRSNPKKGNLLYEHFQNGTFGKSQKGSCFFRMAYLTHLINVVTTTVQGVQQQPYDTKKLKEFALYGYIAAPRLVQC